MNHTVKHSVQQSTAKKLFSVVLGLTSLLAGTAGWAADYPDKPVKFVVTAAPGGSSDLLARKLSQIMQAQTNATFVIENRPGASGSIGLLSMIRAKPDGYI
jgi:tripartite-type tricarboxylate transporter receptor subunit TctC